MWLVRLLIDSGFRAAFGFLEDLLASLRHDAAMRQEGRREEADRQAKAGERLDAAIGDVADRPLDDEAVLGRLEEGSA